MARPRSTPRRPPTASTSSSSAAAEASPDDDDDDGGSIAAALVKDLPPKIRRKSSRPRRRRTIGGRGGVMSDAAAPRTASFLVVLWAAVTIATTRHQHRSPLFSAVDAAFVDVGVSPRIRPTRCVGTASTISSAASFRPDLRVFSTSSSESDTEEAALDLDAPPLSREGDENDGADEPEEVVVDVTASASAVEDEDKDDDKENDDDSGGPPPWMRCVNGVAPRTMPLNEAVSTVADVSLAEANDLIEIGAVWARMDLLNEDDLMDQYYSNSANAEEGDVGNDSWTMDGAGKVSYADLPKGWGGGEHRFAKFVSEEEDLEEYVERMARQRYRRVTRPSVIDAGTDIRVYPRPRRFPACYELADERRLLYEDTTFVVVDKPPLLPTQPDASNYRECCPGCVNDLLGPFETADGRRVRRPLLCHRVDSVVGGCVVLSKDGHGQKVFAKLQRERKLKKLYLTLTTEPVPLGMHVHWMWAPANARGQMGGPSCQFVSHAPPASRRKARESWIRCVLEVVRCEEIEVDGDDDDSDSDGEGHGYDPPPGVKHYQSTVRLVTGRKHQVRAQLASLGCPIVRDTLYGPIAGLTLDKLGNDVESEEEMDKAVSKTRIPTEPIGLQAHAILFGGVRAKAGTPWWGDRVVVGPGAGK